jgi:hypothetical protein
MDADLLHIRSRALDARRLCRGCSKASERAAPAERADEAVRRGYMLSPEALRQELNQWVAHDCRWITFRDWMEVSCGCSASFIKVARVHASLLLCPDMFHDCSKMGFEVEMGCGPGLCQHASSAWLHAQAIPKCICRVLMPTPGICVRPACMPVRQALPASPVFKYVSLLLLL